MDSKDYRKDIKTDEIDYHKDIKTDIDYHKDIKTDEIDYHKGIKTDETDDDDCGDECRLNGLTFNNLVLPEDVLLEIFSYCDADTLLKLTLVCKYWRQLINVSIWKLKANNESKHSFSTLTKYEKSQLHFPHQLYYIICKYDSFNKNLIKNNCGQEECLHWERFGRSAYDPGWKIEETPHGSDPLPDSPDFNGCTSCFATTYYDCKKVQVIVLKEHGFNDMIMDHFQPPIIVSEWFAGRFDCGCSYKLVVSLQDNNGKLITKKKISRRIKQWEGHEWHKVEVMFENYGVNVRKVSVLHIGVDTQYWAGHYGSKMAGATLKVLLPMDADPRFHELNNVSSKSTVNLS